MNKQQEMNFPRGYNKSVGSDFLRISFLLSFFLIVLSSCASHRSGQYVLESGKWVFKSSRVGFQSLFRGSEAVEDTKSYVDSGDFIWPVPGSKRISSHYGKRGRRHHDGLDIAAKSGTHIIASAKGTISFVGRMRGYGKTVVIKHSNGHHTVYAHNSKNYVRKGQRVTQGEVIANVGSTGRSTGPHLHFEIRKNNKARNPAGYLARLKK